MKIAPDKINHMKGGVVVTLFCVVAAAGMLWLKLHPLAIVAVLSGWVAGLSVEGEQDFDNHTSGEKRHEISFWDALATALPGMLVGVIIEGVANPTGFVSVLKGWVL